MKMRHLVSLLGFGLMCALALPVAFADNARDVRTEPITCTDDEELTFRNVEIRADKPITVKGECELELVDVVIRGQGTILTASDDGEVELESSKIHGSVTLSDDAELDQDDSTIHENLTLEGTAEADLEDSTVKGNISVAEGADLDDEGGNELPTY